MSGQQTHSVTPKRLRRASWLAVVALAWMQLAIAGHQFEHSTTYLELCDVCVQLERFDNAVAIAAPAIELSQPNFEIIVPRPKGLPTETVNPACSPRAPPVI